MVDCDFTFATLQELERHHSSCLLIQAEGHCCLTFTDPNTDSSSKSRFRGAQSQLPPQQAKKSHLLRNRVLATLDVIRRAVICVCCFPLDIQKRKYRLKHRGHDTTGLSSLDGSKKGYYVPTIQKNMYYTHCNCSQANPGIQEVEGNAVDKHGTPARDTTICPGLPSELDEGIPRAELESPLTKRQSLSGSVHSLNGMDLPNMDQTLRSQSPKLPMRASVDLVFRNIETVSPLTKLERAIWMRPSTANDFQTLGSALHFPQSSIPVSTLDNWASVTRLNISLPWVQYLRVKALGF